MLTTRKKTLTVNIWWVLIGWDNPIVIQSMTDTPTADIQATLAQIIELADAGSELVRITVDNKQSAKAVPEIINQLQNKWYNVPIIWDFHYNGHILLNDFPEMAKALSKFRINPGNVGKWDKHDENYKQIVQCAIKYNKPVRIWINWWSLDDELLNYNMEKNAKLAQPLTAQEIIIDSIVESAILSVKKAVEIGLPKDRIIIACKVSNIQNLIIINEKLSQQTDCPLHLWLTEAWWSTKWIVASSAALWILLQQWIWDTIRVSITPEPGKPRSLEVEVCKYLLQSMSFRYFQPMITSCPGCGRTSSDRFQVLAKQISDEIQIRLPIWKKKYKWFEKTNISIMWCVVNGIGEAKHADIGIFFPWNAEKPIVPVYIKWKPYTTFQHDDDIFNGFMQIIENYFKS